MRLPNGMLSMLPLSPPVAEPAPELPPPPSAMREAR